MSEEREWQVEIGPLIVGLHTTDSDVEQRLRALFASFTPADGVADVRISVHRVDDRADGGAGATARRHVATIDDVEVARSGDLAVVEALPTRRINRLVLDAEDDRLHLHAGAVERDGVVVLVVGPSGSGKSTLVAALGRAGWRILSDEQLGVAAGGRLVPFPRPITLRRRSWDLIDIGIDAEDADESLDRIEVPVSAVGSPYLGSPVAPTVIVRPDLSRQESSAEPMSQAETLSTLLVDTLDLEWAGREGITALLALCGHAPGHRVIGTDLAATVEIVAELAQGAVGPGAVAATASSTGEPHDPRAPEALAWLFADGSAAIHDPVDGALAVVGRDGYEAWELFGVAPEHRPVALDESDFAAQLADAGFLRRSTPEEV